MTQDRDNTQLQSNIKTAPIADGLRIAIIAACPFPTLQGSQVLIRQHAQEMAARGHDVHVVTYHLGTPEPIEGVNIHRIPNIPHYKRLRAGPSWAKPFLDLLLMIKLFFVARREGIDIFHAHNIEGVAAAWLVARLLRKPLIFHTHTLMESELPTYYQSPRAKRIARHIGRWFDTYLPRLADFTITLSSEARSTLIQLGTRSEKLIYLPPGIETQNVERCDSPEALRVRYGLGNGPLAIYTGNLDAYQGLDDLLTAFALVHALIPDAQLIIASHDAPNSKLDLSGAGVRFFQVSDFQEAAALLDISNVAVCARPACLGYPIKLLNYMSAGKAIICARGSARDMEHMRNGFIYNDGDVNAFAIALTYILQYPSLARRLGDYARMTARQYNWSTLAEVYQALYDAALRKQTRRVATLAN